MATACRENSQASHCNRIEYSVFSQSSTQGKAGTAGEGGIFTSVFLILFHPYELSNNHPRNMDHSRRGIFQAGEGRDQMEQREGRTAAQKAMQLQQG
jgi:hypothetical protein